MNKEVLSAKEYLHLLSVEFDKNRHAKQAEAMKKYMKGQYNYYGLKAPMRTALLKEHIKRYGLPQDWRKVVHLSWLWEEREMQYVGMELAYRCRKKITEADIELLKYLIVEKSWWDTVDFIASNLMGHYFFAFPKQIDPITHKWTKSNNMWLIRTCLLFQLKYKEYTNFKLLQQFIHQHKYSGEFFIQKAIGWALRQYARIDPYQVQAFVTETELKPLSRREALKHFS